MTIISVMIVMMLQQGNTPTKTKDHIKLLLLYAKCICHI